MVNRPNEKAPTYFKDDGIRYDLVINQQVYKYYVDKKTRLIKKWFDKKKLLLDVGCGTGAYTTTVTKECKMIVGVDASSRMIEQGRSKARRLGLDNICFVVGDISHLPFRDKVFDLVFSVNLFHHIAVENSILLGVHEKVRCSKQGGHVLVFELNPNSLGWSEKLIPKLIRGLVYLLLFPFRQHAIEHKEEGTKIANIPKLFGGIKKIKVCFKKVGGFIPPYCPKFLFKSFVLLEKIMEATPLLRRYGAHVVVVGEVQ
jgi:ubiquinone/menaquinone biosynthesis C-methylase UbiE